MQVNDTMTVALFHPKAFASGDLEPLMTGGVRSMLILFSVTLPELPARSIQSPVVD